MIDSSSDALATAAMNWRALSLKRLVHWDELRRTGRWRRHFQTEEAFEEAVRNANADAERWRQLADRYVALSAEEGDRLWSLSPTPLSHRDIKALCARPSPDQGAMLSSLLACVRSRAASRSLARKSCAGIG